MNSCNAISTVTERYKRKIIESRAGPLWRFLAHRFISPRPGNSVPFGAKRTSAEPMSTCPRACASSLRAMARITRKAAGHAGVSRRGRGRSALDGNAESRSTVPTAGIKPSPAYEPGLIVAGERMAVKPLQTWFPSRLCRLYDRARAQSCAHSLRRDHRNRAPRSFGESDVERGCRSRGTTCEASTLSRVFGNPKGDA